MKTAVELLDVIEASHLPVTGKLVEGRDDVIRLVEDFLLQADGKDDGAVAEQLAELLLGEGAVLGDRESLQDVITEYLHVVADENGSLGEDEKNFLDSFLK